MIEKIFRVFRIAFFVTLLYGVLDFTDSLINNRLLTLEIGILIALIVYRILLEMKEK